MNLKIQSIKAKLLILLLVSISCSFFILGFYNTKNAYEAQYNLIHEKQLDLAKQTSKFINSYLQSKILIVEAVKNELPKNNLNITNKNIINKLLLGKKAGDFVDLYIGFEENGDFLLSDGSYLNVQKDNFDARKRPWYKQAVKEGKSGVTKPYVDITTKKLVVTVFTPYKVDGKVLGVVGSDIFLTTVVDTILNVKVGELGGSAFLVDSDKTTLIHKDEKLLNKENSIFVKAKNNQENRFTEVTQDGVEKLISYSQIPISNWYLVVELNKDTIYVQINSNIYKEIGLYIILLAVILGLLYFALVKILVPLKGLESGLYAFFRYLKGEQSNVEKLNIETNYEFGNMAKQIDTQIELVSQSFDKDKELIENVKTVVNRVKEGRLDLHVEKTTSNKSLNELKDILNEMIETVSNNVDKDINVILNSIKNYSELNFVDNIANPSGNISKGLNDLCNIINQMLQENKANGLALTDSSSVLLTNVEKLNTSSNQTAVSLEETAAAVEEITSTIVNNTNRIGQMQEYSNDLSASIDQGHELANSTVTSMDEINEQTQAIAEAITIIDQIAFQTNILSLNAAVEAATAGEAGRGFAVVAQEVRNLASRSAEAAKEIKDLVESATDKTNKGKHIADSMIQGYTKLNEAISQTTEVISDIADASSEQKTSIEQINDVINKLDQQTQSNAAVATQTHDIAENTSEIAKKILDAVNQKQFRN